MAAIPAPADPTLAAVDAAIEVRGNAEQHRPYLGMSAIGRACSRALWYGFRWCSPNTFDAATLKRFEDGHRGEDIQADRLRLVEGIELLTIDPRTGRQFGYVDHAGHFRGHSDGLITGILQAPATQHVWEHKQVADKKQAELIKAKAEHGDKMEEGEHMEEAAEEPEAAMEDKVEALVDAIAAAIEEETGVAVEVEAEEEAGEEMADAEMDAEEGDMEAAADDMADAEEDMADDMMEEAALEEIVAEVTNRVQKRLVKESLKRRLASKLR